MKYIAAHMLAVLGGEKTPDAQDIARIIGSVGGDVDMEMANAVLSALQDKDLNEVIAEGKKLIWSCGAVTVSPAIASVVSAPAALVEEEDKKNETDSDGSGIFNMFD